MQKTGGIWYALLGLFYLGLGWLAFAFYQQDQEIQAFRVDEEITATFPGNDWVGWQHTEQGVVASHVHPLPFYKPLDKDRIRQGDRLRALDNNEITQAEVVDQITRSARPGTVFIAEVERTDPFSLTVEKLRVYLINGFRLGFSFNSVAAYWHLIGWIVGLGAFASLIMLAILLPIARGNWREFLPLTGIVGSALIFFLLQLLRHLYLIVESDLKSVGVEKFFLIAYVALLFFYVLHYFYFKSECRRLFLMLPSMLVGGYLLVRFYQIIYLEEQLKFYFDALENVTLMFFFLHLLGGLLLHLSLRWREKALRSLLGLSGMVLLSGLGVAYYATAGSDPWFLREHALFAFYLLLFFPLVNSAFLQLQFGKVSLVITQTMQYLVFFVVSLLIYLLITQLFDQIRPNIPYRRLLEFLTFLITVVTLRFIYLANESKFRKYFVSSQQEKLTKLKSFLAQIPQYTSSRNLRNDLVRELEEYFGAETVQLWWKGDEPAEGSAGYHDKLESIYQQLASYHTNWSRTKEIAKFRLTNDLEKLVLDSPYNLLCPVTVDEENYALLMLGKKKRSVYNLGDLEMISQLIQQTQLTLNVLQLYAREKELIQQTYEANLTALRSQINPHFLFNTLNSIGELVHESPEQAEEAVEKLAFIFRYTLRMSSQNFVTLANEMNLISNYLDLEKIRFGERLEVHLEVDPEVKDVQVPSFILSTLVENCIKHGVSKILGKGLVSVEAARKDDYLVCEVVDNGPGIDLSRIFKSTGLSNSIARLENIYDEKDLLYFENTGEGTYVRLRIPLVSVPESELD
jgi:sensor histidine kinase YesM